MKEKLIVTIVGKIGELNSLFQGSQQAIIAKLAIVPKAAINILPMKMKSPPIPATIPNLAGFLNIRKKASFAAKQNIFPDIAIFRIKIKKEKPGQEPVYKRFCSKI